MPQWFINVSKFLAIFTSITLALFLYVEWGTFALMGVLWATDYQPGYGIFLFCLYILFWSLKQGGLGFLCISVYVYLSGIYYREGIVNYKGKIGPRVIWRVYLLCSFLTLIFLLMPHLPKLMPATLAILIYTLQVVKPNIIISMIFNIFYPLFFAVLCVIFPPNFNWALAQYLGPTYSDQFIYIFSCGLVIFGSLNLFLFGFYQVWRNKVRMGDV
ncbi:MAG: hypothetical protein ACRCVN_06130 [Spirochaetia bacterium]